MRPDQIVQRIAAGQHGVITRQQALTAGLTDVAIRHRWTTGRWERAGPGVYVVGGSRQTWEQRVAGTVLSVGDSCASHLTAAKLWGIIESEPERVDVTVAYGTRRRNIPATVIHRATTLERRDVRTIAGIRTTCPARTLVDVAGSTNARQLARMLDRALLAGLTSVAVVRWYVHDRRLTTVRGAGRLARLLADRTAGVPEGDLERVFLEIVRRHRLPPPTRQHRVGRFRLDFSYPAGLIAIELDDVGSHGTPGGLQSDLHRQNHLILLGWTVLRFTYADLTTKPTHVAATIGKALKRTHFCA